MENIEHSQNSFLTSQDLEILGYILKNFWKVGKIIGTKIESWKYEVLGYEFNKNSCIYSIEIDIEKSWIITIQFPLKKIKYNKEKNSDMKIVSRSAIIFQCWKNEAIQDWIRNISARLYISDPNEIYIEEDLPF